MLSIRICAILLSLSWVLPPPFIFAAKPSDVVLSVPTFYTQQTLIESDVSALYRKPFMPRLTARWMRLFGHSDYKVAGFAVAGILWVAHAKGATLDFTQSPDSLRHLALYAQKPLVSGEPWTTGDKKLMDRAVQVLTAYAKTPESPDALRKLLSDPGTVIHIWKGDVKAMALAMGRSENQLLGITRETERYPDDSVKEAFIAIDGSRFSDLGSLLETAGHEFGHISPRDKTTLDQPSPNREYATFTDSIQFLEFAKTNSLLTAEEQAHIEAYDLPLQRDRLGATRPSYVPMEPGQAVTPETRVEKRPLYFIETPQQLAQISQFRSKSFPRMVEFTTPQRQTFQRAVRVIQYYAKTEKSAPIWLAQMMNSNASVVVVQGAPEEFSRLAVEKQFTEVHEPTKSVILGFKRNGLNLPQAIVIAVHPESLATLPDALETLSHAVLGHGTVVLFNVKSVAKEDMARGITVNFLETVASDPNSPLSKEDRDKLLHVQTPNERPGKKTNYWIPLTLAAGLGMLGLVKRLWGWPFNKSLSQKSTTAKDASPIKEKRQKSPETPKENQPPRGRQNRQST